MNKNTDAPKYRCQEKHLLPMGIVRVGMDEIQERLHRALNIIEGRRDDPVISNLLHESLELTRIVTNKYEENVNTIHTALYESVKGHIT